MSRHLFALLSAAVVAVASSAAPVGPGQSIVFPAATDGGTDILNPGGVEIASKTIHFTVPVVSADTDLYPGYVPDRPFAEGTVITSVRRDSSNKLAFVYDFDFPVEPEGVVLPAYLDNLSQLVVGNFAGFTTDFVGLQGTTIDVQRSADGSTITSTTGSGLGSEPFVVIRTNATSFDANGTAILRGATDYVPAHNAEGDKYVLDVTTTANLNGLYQPAESTAAIPLPPAVYGGAALLGFVCATQLFRGKCVAA